MRIPSVGITHSREVSRRRAFEACWEWESSFHGWERGERKGEEEEEVGRRRCFLVPEVSLDALGPCWVGSPSLSTAVSPAGLRRTTLPFLRRLPVQVYHRVNVFRKLAPLTPARKPGPLQLRLVVVPTSNLSRTQKGEREGYSTSAARGGTVLPSSEAMKRAS